MISTKTTSDRHRTDPPHNCRRCKRLTGFRTRWRKAVPDWHNGPVRTWVDCPDTDVRILIVGLAPGLRGANRTGLPFTGDASGDLLFDVLVACGLARAAPHGHSLHGLAITNAVRCVPPDNRPTGEEVSTCRTHYLTPTLYRFGALESIVTLGRTAHDATVRAAGQAVADHPFGHGNRSELPIGKRKLSLTASYHCSRYNQNTGRISRSMLMDVFRPVL